MNLRNIIFAHLSCFLTTCRSNPLVFSSYFTNAQNHLRTLHEVAGNSPLIVHRHAQAQIHIVLHYLPCICIAFRPDQLPPPPHTQTPCPPPPPPAALTALASQAARCSRACSVYVWSGQLSYLQKNGNGSSSTDSSRPSCRHGQAVTKSAQSDNLHWMATFRATKRYTPLQTPHASLKVVCRLALTIWSYWHGCREQIFLNISNASNYMETL